MQYHGHPYRNVHISRFHIPKSKVPKAPKVKNTHLHGLAENSLQPFHLPLAGSRPIQVSSRGTRVRDVPGVSMTLKIWGHGVIDPFLEGQKETPLGCPQILR